MTTGNFAVTLREWEPERILAECGASLVTPVPQILLLSAAPLPGCDPAGVLAALVAHPGVRYAYPEPKIVRLGAYNAPATGMWGTQTLDTPYLSDVTDEPWGMERIGLLHAHTETTGSPDVIVAYVDDGFIPHVDLPTIPPERQHTIGGTEGSAAPGDPTTMTHGTEVAGVMWGKANALGVTGIAPDCLPVAVNHNGTGLSSSLVNGAAGIVWIADLAQALGKKAVVNCSWGMMFGSVAVTGSADDLDPVNLYGSAVPLHSAVQYAKARNTKVVAAAGNSGEDMNTTSWYPAELPDVLCVGAFDRADKGSTNSYDDGNDQISVYSVDATSHSMIYGSNHGTSIDIVAPGNMVPTTTKANGYMWFGGTSGAAPHVTAALGNIMSAAQSAITWDEAEAILKETAGPPECFSVGAEAGFRMFFPNAGVLDLARSAKKAKAVGSPGTVKPFLRFSRAGDTPARRVRLTVAGDVARTDFPQQPGWDRVNAEVNAFVVGKTIAEVELWAGDSLVYRGPRTSSLSATTRFTGGVAVPLTIVARTTDGEVVPAVYDDFNVTEMAAFTIVSAGWEDGVAVVVGTRTHNADVAPSFKPQFTGQTGTVRTLTTPTATTWRCEFAGADPDLPLIFTAYDGVTSLSTTLRPVQPGTIVRCRVDGALLASASRAAEDGTFTLTIPGLHMEGDHTIEVTAQRYRADAAHDEEESLVASTQVTGTVPYPEE